MKFLILLLSSFSLTLSAQMNAYYQQHAAYTMEIDVDVEKYQYHGKQKVVYTNNSPETLNKVYFHLYWNAFQPGSMMDQRIAYMGNQADGRMIKKENDKIVSRIKDLSAEDQGFHKILSLKQKGKTLNYTIEGTIMEVELAVPINAEGGTTTFEMEWDAQVPEQIRRSGKQNKEGIEFSMTQWYPKMAEYDYEGWHTWEYVQREFQGVFASFDVTINIDKDYIVAAGGVLQNPKEVKGYDKDAKLNKDISSWKYLATDIHDFAWAADPDYIIETAQVPDGPLLYFARQNKPETEFWKLAEPKAVEFFQIMNNKFGKYLYPTYTFAQGGDGGMEYGMITLIMGNGRGNDDESKMKGHCGLMFHEAAHSWFQQMIATNESMRAWMDEGFTSFAEAYCMNQIFGSDEQSDEHFNADAVYGLVDFQKSGREELMSNLADHYETAGGYSVAAYVKGSAFLSGISYITGDETMWNIMMEYYNVWKLKHPNERDFLHIAQLESDMDLKWYFNYFIGTTEQIDYSIEDHNSKGKNTTILLKNNGIFPMPIDLLVTLKNGEKITYTIPLQMMRGAKEKDLFPIEVLPDWQWTNKEYTATLPYPAKKIEKVEIDGTGRLPNVSDKTSITF